MNGLAGWQVFQLPSGTFGTALWSTLALSSLVWCASLWRRDASLVDRFWAVFIALNALVYAGALGWLEGSSPARRATVLVLVALWAVRLGLHISRRNWGHGEDRRYQAVRARNQPGFALKSLFLIFWLQAVLAWVLTLPLASALSGPAPWGLLDGLGTLVALLGWALEALADAQLNAFRAVPANRGEVLDQGLWRYSRHPNYFGEACFWWGIWLFAPGAWGVGALWTALVPVLMTLLLLKVSGVHLLEQDIGERRPAYRDYIERTPAFVPGWRPSGKSTASSP